MQKGSRGVRSGEGGNACRGVGQLGLWGDLTVLPRKNNFLKLDRFIRIMGKFILCYLLHLVTCIYIYKQL